MNDEDDSAGSDDVEIGVIIEVGGYEQYRSGELVFDRGEDPAAVMSGLAMLLREMADQFDEIGQRKEKT